MEGQASERVGDREYWYGRRIRNLDPHHRRSAGEFVL